MFRTKLETELKNIFGFKKVSFAQPPESNEQDILFVNITACKYRPSETSISGRITGKMIIYSTQDKMPFGFIIKKLHISTVDDKDLFFYNIEENVNYGGAIGLVERSCDFIYFYKEQFNPNRGEITEVNFN